MRLHGLMAAAAVLAAVMAAGGCVADLPSDIARVKGYDALRAEEYGKAREHFAHCVQRDPTDWKSHYYLGRTLLHEGEAAEARRHLEIAHTIRQAKPEMQLAPQPGAPETAVPWPSRNQIVDALAEAMDAQGERQRLLAFLRDVVDDHGTQEDYLRLGRYLQKHGDHDGARAAYLSAARVALAGDPTAYIELAAFYDAIGDRQQALTALRKAYFIAPETRGLADRIRSHGMVPGPTIALPPEQ